MAANPSQGELTLDGVTIANGRAEDGGGISNSTRLTVRNTTFSGNRAIDDGGAIVNFGDAIIANSTFSGNSADQEGGAIVNFGVATIANSTFSGNSAGLGDGGAGNNGGGAIFNSDTATGTPATMTVINSTVAGNSNNGLGGGIATERGGTITLRNTLIAANIGAGGGRDNCIVEETGGTIADGGGNLDDGITCGFSLSNATAGLDPLGLRNNGGQTDTIAVVVGSDAIDLGVNSFCADPNTVNNFDQRGAPRPIDGDGDGNAFCDIGAFESAAVAPPPPPLPPPPPPSPPPPSSPDPETEPLVLSNPQPFGCELAAGEIICSVPETTFPFILFDVEIPADARFLQFQHTFSRASGMQFHQTFSTAGGRASLGGLGGVFISNVPITTLRASDVLGEGVFQSAGQSPLPASATGRPVIMAVANFPSSDGSGSVFRLRNFRIDRCTRTCFGRRATMCGSNDPERLTGTRRSDVIVGRGGNDTITGLDGNDRICGGDGNDRLSGGTGNDRLDGGAGRDRLLGQDGQDLLRGGMGRDRCDGGSGSDRASGCERTAEVP